MPVSFYTFFTKLPRDATLIEAQFYDEMKGAAFNELKKELAPDYHAAKDYRQILRELATLTVPDIKNSVKEFMNTYPVKKSIGVHIRRQEGKYGVFPMAVPLACYVARMREFSCNETSFFICTDDPDVFVYMKRHFGKYVYQREQKEHDRVTKEGCKAALIDLLLLSYTRCILGTPSSTFSGIAAMMGDRQCIWVKFAWPDHKDGRILRYMWDVFFRDSLFYKKLLLYLYSLPMRCYHKYRAYKVFLKSRKI